MTIAKLKSIIFLILSIVISNNINAQTTIENINDNWTFKVDTKPYEIKGVTFGPVDDVDNYDKYFKDLTFLGVNTIRTWATGKNTKALLDAAQKYNIKVMAGIWMRHGKPGMEDDDRFDYLKDDKGKEDQYENAINFVKKYKNHPAILTWGIGNEVYLNIATAPEKLAYSKLLEKICSEVKKLDPNHPITSVDAWTFGMDWWSKHVPSIDIYGLNSYGPGVQFLQTELEKKNIDKPYIITEFGVRGEWDIKEKKNDIKIEPSDEEKYSTIANGYSDWITSKPKNLGVFVFHYEDNNKHLAPWLLTQYKGSLRPQYWAIRKAFTGKDPENSIPTIELFELPNKSFKSKSWVPVTLKANDLENESLSISFSYNQRTGSRKRRDQIVPLESKGSLEKGFEIQLPEVDGAIKVYAEVKDTYNNMAIAFNSIVVNDKKARKNKYLVPKAEIPFYVYKDSGNIPYAPSGYMGDFKDLKINMSNTKEVHSGKTAIKLSYNSNGGWYGLAFQDPGNDWGDSLGGYNIDGAKTLSFWAKSNSWDARVEFGFGLIDKDKKYPDTSKKSIDVKLSTIWEKYTIEIKKEDMSCIKTGFVLFSGGIGTPYEIYIDDIVFE